ncbi:MAG TPA: AraC family transcriptional regulator [Polyangia bacterium]|nr:AraC family transcriptional regulator [Polyangia bacterium]
MSAPLRSSEPAAVVAGLRALHRLRRCLAGLGDLPAFVLRHDVKVGRIDWWELLKDERRLRPFDFEFHFGVAGRRDVYHAENLAKLRATGQAQLTSLLGFSDLYVPLVTARSFTLVFYCGQWSRELPTRETILGVWRELSGHEPVVEDLIFRQWARCCLSVPILTAAVQEGLIELGALLGQLFSDNTETVERRIERLRDRVFLPTTHDESWVSSCLDLTGLTRPPWGLDEFMDERIVEETRLRHRPSQLAILMPKPSDRAGLDQLDRWIGQRQFQHHATLLARQMPDCVAAPLGDHAVLVAFAADPALRGRVRQSHFESRCRQLQQTLQQQLGVTSVAGLGVEVAPGQGLGQCFRHATMALERADREGKAVMSATVKRTGAAESTAGLHRAGERLKRAFELGRADDARVELLHYSREVLAATGGRAQAMAVHFLLLLRDVLSSLEARGVLQPARGRALHAQLMDDLAALADPQSLMAEFERAVAGLGRLATERDSADRLERLRGAVDWLRENLGVQDATEVCAQRAGLATSSFRRAFRVQYGVPFAAWLREQRLNAAKRTLVLSALAVSEVARDSGFGDVHTFIRCFRARFGRTPGAFRREGRLDGVS